MLSDLLFALLFVGLTAGEPTAPGIDRTLSPGVTSVGYNIIYGDEDLTLFNEVVNEVEQKALKSKIRLNSGMKELPVEDVKCLMSADHYCTKAMKETKEVIIQAIQNDCKTCTTAQKEGAGKVIASMMTYDPTAWKLFMTRIALLIKAAKKIPQPAPEHYRVVGEPEEVVGIQRYTMPGVKVRVRRYATEKVNPNEFQKHTF